MQAQSTQRRRAARGRGKGGQGGNVLPPAGRRGGRRQDRKDVAVQVFGLCPLPLCVLCACFPCERRDYPTNRRTMSVSFWPPKPKLLLMATSTRALRAALGT